jgi:Tol biopolymer transport system component
MRARGLAATAACAAIALGLACSGGDEEAPPPPAPTAEAGAPDAEIFPGFDAAGYSDVRQEDPPRLPCILQQIFLPQGLVGGTVLVGNQTWPRLTRDEKSIFFIADKTGIPRLYRGVRSSFAEDFNPTILGDLDATNNPPLQAAPSADGLTVVFARTSGPATGDSDLYLARRPDDDSEFGPPVTPDVNDPGKDESQPFLAMDGTELLYVSTRSGTPKIYSARAEGGSYRGRQPVLDPASPEDELAPVLSADKRVLFFGSSRAGGQGKIDIWYATRDDPQGKFGPPKNVVELNGPNDDLPGWYSPDGCRLYYHSTISVLPSNVALYRAERAH